MKCTNSRAGTRNAIARRLGPRAVPAGAGWTGKNPHRLCANGRSEARRQRSRQREVTCAKPPIPGLAGSYKKLAQVKQSRVLVSSRCIQRIWKHPAVAPVRRELQNKNEGLTDEDAVELWRAFGVSGSRDDVLPIFNTFGKHPLLIQALAGEVKRYRGARRFDAWRKANPKFDPSRFSDSRRRCLTSSSSLCAACKIKLTRYCTRSQPSECPLRYDTLAALLVGEGKPRYELSTNKLVSEEWKLCADEHELDAALD